MNRLTSEAIKIKNDLGSVVFIGGLAVLLQTKSGRQTDDIDFAVARPLSGEFLDGKKYFEHNENGKIVRRTPRGYKVDIYSKDVSGIPVYIVVETTRNVSVDAKNVLKVACVEVLIVAKHRAARKQDRSDLSLFAAKWFDDLDWDLLKSLTESEIEFETIRKTLQFYHDL